MKKTAWCIHEYVFFFCAISLIIAAPGCLTAIKNTAEYGAPALKIASGAAKAARPVSPSEEYYLGRTVTAKFLLMYPLLENEPLTDYLSFIGYSLAMNSETPVTFGGYHFAILDTDEPNAFACPGGTILISKGLIAQTQNEDELAAVLAHEISHIHYRDGIAAIKSSRWTKALAVIGSVAVDTYGSKEFGQLVSLFEGSVEDVIETLVVKGYSRKQELRADQTAVHLLDKTGYEPSALYAIVHRLANNRKEYSLKGIMATHPMDDKRLDAIKKEVSESTYGEKNIPEKRALRFEAYLSDL